MIRHALVHSQESFLGLHSDHMTAVRAWTRRHPALWVSVVLFFASYIFVYSFGRVTHWTTGFPLSGLKGFCRWDCGWYSDIVAHGYALAPNAHPGGDAANWAFFPLFPLSAMVMKHLFHMNPLAAAVAAARLEYLIAIFSFLLWLQPFLEDMTEYFLAGALIGLSPYMIYGQAGYSEPLYFSLACLGFWALERKKWIVAGLLGAGLSATRLVGILFALVFAIVVLRDVGWRSVLKDRSLAIPIGILLCPVGLVLYAIYLYYHTGDALAFLHVEVAWGRATTNPAVVVLHSFQAGGWFGFWAFVVVAGLLVSFWLMLRRLEYGIFLAFSIIVPAASGSLYGVPRYLWWQPPFLYAVFLFLRRSLPMWMIYLVFAGGMASFIIFRWFTLNSLVT